MTYPLSFRKKVVSLVKSGRSRVDVSNFLGISVQTIYRWMHADDLAPKKHGPRHRKIDKAALRAHVRDFPDALLRERAAHFGVRISAIGYALKVMNIVKKNDADT